MISQLRNVSMASSSKNVLGDLDEVRDDQTCLVLT